MRNLFSQSTAEREDDSAGPATPPARVLRLACLAHALHDGYTDTLYVLLPVWQADFGLGFGALAALRGMYAGTMATLQVPAGRLTARFGRRMPLALGTLLAALGYLAAGMAGSLAGLCIALALAGSGSSTQHPIASGAVAQAYAGRVRGPLGIYNFSGDIGKSTLPPLMSLLLTVMPWRHALWWWASGGALAALAIALRFPVSPRDRGMDRTVPQSDSGGEGSNGAGFALLSVIGVLDTGVRMGVLTFLPFLLKEKGVSAPVIGTALALVFVGGAAGKFVCGWFGARLGVTGTVLATEGGTAACILAVVYGPTSLALALLPLLGLMLNGTSSVLYGTVPELASGANTERAFALFYTGTIGLGALAPVVYGVLGDRIGVHGALFVTALTALAIVPLMLVLHPRLASAAASGARTGAA